MPRRNRNFRKSHANITPNMLWILCGFVLGHNVRKDDNKKFATITLRESKRDIKIQRNAVDSLKSIGMVELLSDNKTFKITGRGFGHAHDHLKIYGIKFKDFNKEKEPSTYIG